MLILPIKKKWFDMIRSGEKKEELDQLETENKNLKNILNAGVNKEKQYCFNEDGNTGRCLGYSNIFDDEPCEYCKSCEKINIKEDD